MNKIQAACIFQTILFSQEPARGMTRERALKANKNEIATYLKNLDNLHIRYQVTDHKEQADGSIILKIRKQQDYITDVKSYFKR